MSRIAQIFASLRRNHRRGLIPYITAGDPDLYTTRELIIELARAGATIIELGVPFSDPMADGPVIQRASERALQNGVTVAEILSTAAQARKQTDIPIVLFSYFNPLLQFGLERLANEAADGGIDGVLVTDLPPEEAEEFSSILAAQGLDLIFLAAPTSTDERLRLISRLAHGFIYAVSRTGVTGTREDLSRDAAQLAERLRRISDLPIAVGFGISKAEHVADVWRFADAAVIGSALVAEIQRLSSTGVEASDPPAIARDIPRYAANFFRSLIPQHIAVGK